MAMRLWESLIGRPRSVLKQRKVDSLYLRRLNSAIARNTHSEDEALIQHLSHELVPLYFGVRSFRDDVLSRPRFLRYRDTYDGLSADQILSLMGINLAFLISAMSERPRPGIFDFQIARQLLFAVAPLCGHQIEHATRWLPLVAAVNDTHDSRRRASFYCDDLAAYLDFESKPCDPFFSTDLSLHVATAGAHWYRFCKTSFKAEEVLESECF
jgi:hypothetical protein